MATAYEDCELGGVTLRSCAELPRNELHRWSSATEQLSGWGDSRMAIRYCSSPLGEQLDTALNRCDLIARGSTSAIQPT